MLHIVAFSKEARRSFRKLLNKKALGADPRASKWVQGLDLNQRPSGYEPATINIEQQLFTQFGTADSVQNHVNCEKVVSLSLPALLEVALRQKYIVGLVRTTKLAMSIKHS